MNNKKSVQKYPEIRLGSGKVLPLSNLRTKFNKFIVSGQKHLTPSSLGMDGWWSRPSSRGRGGYGESGELGSG